MPRVFNTAGPCLPEEHYMIPYEARTSQVRGLIDGKHFFVLHAPRQTGKTTLLQNLSRDLTAQGRHVALAVSLENFTSSDPSLIIPQIVEQIAFTSQYRIPPEHGPPDPQAFSGSPHVLVQQYLSAWAGQLSKPLVILFDEIDSLQGEVLVNVLRQLRNGYTARPDPFPTSVALVGLKDVREYRSKVRPQADTLGSSSPFNIKVRSLTLANFTAQEVAALLMQHTDQTGQGFEPAAVEEIFYQTQGQPWLVNALAGQLTTDYDALVKDRSHPVTRAQVMEAREILIERRDTHLDSLVARLGEDRIRRVVEPILTGQVRSDDTYDNDFQYAKDLGLVAVIKGVRRIANPIYQEIIPRVLTHQTQTSIDTDPAWYVLPDGTLDLDKLIEQFLVFWRRHGEVLLRGMSYREAGPHIVFMAYLQRVVNSGGRIDREFAVGTGRADLVVSFGGREDIIELKLWRAQYTLDEGLDQVARYAQRLGRDRGYLVMIDPRSSLPWDERGSTEEIQHREVTVVVVRG